MIDTDDQVASGHIGMLDIMSTLALLFILMAAIFMMNLREQTSDLGTMNKRMSIILAQNDSMKNALEQQIIHLSETEEKYADLKRTSDSMSVINYLSMDSLKEKNLVLIKELNDRQIAKIIIPNELKGKVFFGSGSAKIEGQFKRTLDKFVTMIKDSLQSGNYNLVQVEGHTDSDKVGKKGKHKDNWDLGASRAISVVKYFASKGIPEKYLSATTHAEYKPTRDEKSEKAKAENRRIEILMLKK